MVPPPLPEPRPQGNPLQGPVKRNLVLLIALLVATFGLMLCCLWLPGGTPETEAQAKAKAEAEAKAKELEQQAADAEMMAREFVKQRLKAPASAVFPANSRAAVTKLGMGRYQVISYVDSQNSFGANLRAPFVCTLRYLGGDQWKLEAISIDEP